MNLYHEVEKAKRRLLFTLMSLGLPVEGRTERLDGLAFRILADARLDEADTTFAAHDEVTTGHAQGEITINLLEADPRLREQMRLAMNESYRTLLGHFRHESGHYYWQRLVAHGDCLEGFRSRFGDERRHYQDSLDEYYREGPPPDWQDHYVVAYASSHPLEDFAECWSHYLHMVDTLQTAADDQLALGDLRFADPIGTNLPFRQLIDQWRALAPAMNDLNRSMGLDDAYPFSLTAPVIGKLGFASTTNWYCRVGGRGPAPANSSRLSRSSPTMNSWNARRRRNLPSGPWASPSPSTTKERTSIASGPSTSFPG